MVLIIDIKIFHYSIMVKACLDCKSNSKYSEKELDKKNIRVNSICPGWVQTDMGGPSATLTVEESTKKIVKFSLGNDFPNGKFLRHGQIIPW